MGAGVGWGTYLPEHNVRLSGLEYLPAWKQWNRNWIGIPTCVDTLGAGVGWSIYGNGRDHHDFKVTELISKTSSVCLCLGGTRLK